MRKRRVLIAATAAILSVLGLVGVSTLAAAQGGPPPGFNPYGTPVNGCDNPILAADASGWGSDTAGATATRGQPGDHIVANWDYNLHTTTAGNARIWMPQRNVVATQVWDYSADVRTDGDAASSHIRADWYNAANVNIGTNVGPDIAIPGTRPYTRVAGTFTVPAGAATAHVLVETSALNASSGFATTMCTYTPHTATTTPPPTTEPTTAPPTTVPPTTVPPTTVPPTTTPPAGTVVFNGDFETGNFNQWPLCQTHTYNGACSGMPAGDYALGIEHPGHQGNSAARFEVHDGDQPFCCGERAQLVGPGNETEGHEYWYSWDVKVDPTFPSSSSWQVLMQWHSTMDGSPPLNFLAEGSNLVLETRPRANEPYTGITNVWTTPLDKGNWHAYQVHVKWSSNANVGYVELWKDGVRQSFTATPPENSNGVCAGTQTCHIRNIYPGDAGNRPMVTYYRDAGINGTGVVHHDNFKVATTQAALG
jgi:Polysaccharide lyase